ncbi:MAG: hypothetical protein ACRDIA_02085 [Actinomycetota bacterium]
MTSPVAPQVLSQWIRRSLEEISAFATEEVLAAFQDLMGDDETWEGAKKDPGELLRRSKVDIPETLSVSFSDVAASGDDPARRCMQICRSEPLPDPGSPPIVWCYELRLL